MRFVIWIAHINIVRRNYTKCVSLHAAHVRASLGQRGLPLCLVITLLTLPFMSKHIVVLTCYCSRWILHKHPSTYRLKKNTAFVYSFNILYYSFGFVSGSPLRVRGKILLAFPLMGYHPSATTRREAYGRVGRVGGVVTHGEAKGWLRGCGG